VTPTTDSRHDFHEQLYTCFLQQDWPDKEIVIIETYRSKPSPFFTSKASKDPSIVFVSIYIPPDIQDMSIGLKRNIGTHLASGDWIASFDDDDFYAPNYVSAMLTEMVKQQALAITLGSWFVFEEVTGACGYVDPRGMDGPQVHSKRTWGGVVTTIKQRDRDEWLYGFGFSYFFSAKHAAGNTFPDQDMGEDYSFFMGLKSRVTTAVLYDEFGLCLHTLHGRSTSSVQGFEVAREEISELDVSGLGQTLSKFLERCPKQGKSSNFASWGRINRQILLHSSQQNLEVSRPFRCTVVDIKRLAARKLSVPSDAIEVYPCAEFSDITNMKDTEQIGIRTSELWMRLPVDVQGPQEVSVKCADPATRDATVSVQVLSTAKFGDVREAVLQEYGGSATTEQKRRLRLARRVGNSTTFIGVDSATPLGEVKLVYISGLAVLLNIPVSD